MQDTVDWRDTVRGAWCCDLLGYVLAGLSRELQLRTRPMSRECPRMRTCAVADCRLCKHEYYTFGTPHATACAPCACLLTQSDARVRALDTSLASLRSDLERERAAAAAATADLEREVRRQAERAEAASSALAGAEKQLEGVTAARECPCSATKRGLVLVVCNECCKISVPSRVCTRRVQPGTRRLCTRLHFCRHARTSAPHVHVLPMPPRPHTHTPSCRARGC